MITGGCGHIGSYVVKKLIPKEPEKIVIIDNMSAYPFDQFDLYCSEFKDKENIEIINGDIKNKKVVENILNDIDIVFHLAAYADVAATIYNPDEDFYTNVVGTYNMLKASLDSNIERFVFASSAAVYGNKPWRDNNPPIFNEEMKLEPISTYANSKMWGENQASLFYRLYGLKTVSVRYFSVYGPKQIPKPKSHSWVVAIFLTRAIKHKPLTVFDGNQVRDFIYVEDIAEATIRAAESEKIIGESVNIGTGRPTKIIELAYLIQELMKEKFNLKVNIEVLKYKPKGDPLGGYADVTKMNTLLDFKPKVELEDGLDKTANWYFTNINKIKEII